MVGVSGPDGAGKSTLVRELRASLQRDGDTVTSIYVYGCLICRRLPPSAGETIRRASRSSGPTPLARSIARGLQSAHGLIDVAELAIRLWIARTRVSLRRNGGVRRRYLVTDRSPLDGMAKHLADDSSALRLYRRLARGYETIVLLCAPAAVLAERDRDHAVPFFSAALYRFDRAAARLPNVVRIETAGRAPAEVLDDARRALHAARG